MVLCGYVCGPSAMWHGLCKNVVVRAGCGGLGKSVQNICLVVVGDHHFLSRTILEKT